MTTVPVPWMEDVFSCASVIGSSCVSRVLNPLVVQQKMVVLML